ncbi:MAG: hypothetical protein M0018_02855 [Nitrospiraceae bacterium]|nr:hypothetical protein [Nitrospiraceae bacterium]
MSQVLAAPLFYIFFVYGLSFIVLSVVLFREIGKASKIAMVSTFSILAAFGLLHGLAEWTDWVRFIFDGGNLPVFAAAGPGAGEPWFLKYVSQILMVVSFTVLLQFAVNMLTYKSENKSARAIPAVLFVLYLIYIFASGTVAQSVFAAGNIGRHLFGFVGGTMAAIALLKLANELMPLGNSRLISGLAAGALGFAYYSVFGGLILHPVIGLPVQLFRMCCAVEIAFSSFYILDVFKA